MVLTCDRIVPWKGRSVCRGLAFVIKILVLLVIKWKPTRDGLQAVASWKKVASPVEDRVVTQNILICGRNRLKLDE